MKSLVSTKTEYDIYHGDCIPHMLEQMPESSVHFSIFSPPFPSIYSYTNHEADIGNSENFRGVAKIHLGWFYRGLARVLMPGRAAIVHVAQLPKMKGKGEGRGLHDFRGLNIRLGQRSGLIYEYDWCIRKNPQSQSIRNRANELKLPTSKKGEQRDRAKNRGAIPDYLIKFTAPGDNVIPVDSKNDVTNNDWIAWAEPAWMDIRETDTLNTKAAKSPEDTRHICPLQLSVINRMVRLYTNPGEIVFSPFAGIGSEGHEALKLGRLFYGCEIKDEYLRAARKNLDNAIASRQTQLEMFGDDDG